jgi:putative DNA methylase
MHPVKAPKKLIEVALPLDDINVAAAREKSIRHGHPSTLHLWWARRPLAAARAVLFAQMVNDPGYETGSGFQRGVNKKDAAIERERLFKIIRELVKWENTNNETVLEAAREEIRKSWRETCKLNEKHPQAADLFNPDKLPAFHDPFAGGGAIPLEAQRLGLEAHASDLNPVAVLINKAMIEIPPKVAGRAPIGPQPAAQEPTARKTREMHEDWSGAKGLAEDVRRYGHWMREQAQQRIGHLYPPVEITAEMAKTRPDLKPLVGQRLTVIAWLWVRTVRSPNPAYSLVHVPLATSFLLASKKGKEAWVRPTVNGNDYEFEVDTSVGVDKRPPDEARSGTKAGGRGAGFRCIVSNSPISVDYIRRQAKLGQISQRLMAVVAEGNGRRIYLPAKHCEESAMFELPTPDHFVEFFPDALGFRIGNYGFSRWDQLFTSRQFATLSVLCELTGEAADHAKAACVQAGYQNSDAEDYARAISLYLAQFVSRMANLNNSFCQWRNDPAKEHVGHLFSRQAVPMVWDYAEANPVGNSAGSIEKTFAFVPKVLDFVPARYSGFAYQRDAARSCRESG